MIDFKRLDSSRREEYDRFLRSSGKGCEYTFVNLSIWGKQQAAFFEDSLVLFSQFGRSSVYPFPIIRCDAKKVLDAIIADAQERNIRCRLTSLSEADCRLLQQLYPGRFRYYPDRDGYDYVYSIDALADLKGRKLQKKRNHLNRFRKEHETAQILPLQGQLLEAARTVARQWYENRCAEDPDRDYHLEERALCRAFDAYQQLGMEGVALVEEGRVLAFAMGSRLNHDTFDIHFEKALEADDGTYAAINQGFAAYLQEKYPEVKWLNREDDMGIEGLRKAKLSYNPTVLVEKCWAQLREEEYDL